MIDFAQARLRRDDESLQEWKERKWMEDEEGAIGYAMGKELGFKFEKSQAGSMKYHVRADEMKYF